MARLLGASPAAPRPLTSEWVEDKEIICLGDDPGTSYDVFEETALAEAGENGSMARVSLGVRGGSSGDVRTLIVKRPPASAAARSVAATQQWYSRETHWYAALAPTASDSVRCPRCHVAEFDGRTGEFVLVLEDLAASGFAPLTDSDTEAGAAALGALHGRFFGAFDGSESTLDVGPLPTMPVTLELAPLIEAYFRECWGRVRATDAYALELDAEATRIVEALAAPGRYAALTEALATPPRTLLHGDFRADNLMVKAGPSGRGKEVCVYDWQFCSLGNGSYDLAYFIALSAEPNERQLREPALRATYLDALRRAGAPPPSPADLDRDLQRGVLLSLASFVIGAATAGDSTTSVETHQRGLRRLSAAARDWGADPAALVPRN